MPYELASWLLGQWSGLSISSTTLWNWVPTKGKQAQADVEAVAYLGRYLEHRRQTSIGIQVLWRGWLKLHDLCEGWRLARGT